MIQIDMEMPDACAYCRFNSGCDDCEGWDNYCTAAGYEDALNLKSNYYKRDAERYKECGEEYIYTPYDHRHEKCPLIEVKTGHWIDTGSGQECSVCGEIQYGYDNGRKFCANCGSPMNEVKDNGID